MKYPSRLCKGCHEPTDTYRTGCRTCQARHRAIRLHKNPAYHQGNLFVLDVGEPLASLFQPVVSTLKITDNASQ